MTQNDTQKKLLTASQLDAVTVLLDGSNITATAQAVGVSRSTIYRWLRQPEFLNALRSAEGTVLDRASRRLILLAEDAVDTLADIMENPNQEGAGQRRYAAQAILTNVLQLWELRNLENRLARLEENIYDQDH